MSELNTGFSPPSSSGAALLRALVPAAIIILLLIAFLCFRKPARVMLSEKFLLMGTLVEFQIPVFPHESDRAKIAIARARDEMARLEELMSPYKAESDVSRINRAAGLRPVRVSTDTLQLISRAREISRITGGAFDISFSPVGRLWKLKGDNPRIPDEAQIREALSLVNYKNIELDEKARTVRLAKPGMEIGLGAIAKGTAVRWGIRVLRENGVENALINAGGDLYAMGRNAAGKPWKVAVQNPRDKSRYITSLQVSDRAVVTSGDYERMVEIDGKRYHHILDTRTGRPAEKCISVTVVARDPETADALSTSLFVLGPEKGLELIRRIPEVEALIITPDMKIHATPAFQL